MDSEEDELKSMSCFCQGMCPYGMEYGTCQTKPGGKCFTSVELDIGDDGKSYPILLYGCLPPNEMALFQCRSNLILTKDSKNIKCCDEYDFCNKHLLPVVEKNGTREIDHFHSMTLKVLLSSIAVSLIFFIAGIILTYLKFKREIREKEIAERDAEMPSIKTLGSSDGLNSSTDGDSGIRLGADSDSTPESSGVKFELVQTTISKQISFELMIASGKFTEIWRAKWRGGKVAVKIYNQREERNWMREINIFQTPLLRHEHILGYIGADVKDNGPNTKLYIFTDYHGNGSLRHYLKNNTVTPMEILQMTKGLASALNHLHTEMIGSSRKPSITHNNINSQNILVKNDKRCCFSDFSKAIKCSSFENITDPPSNIHNAEIRYLAPEFLEQSFSPTSIEPFKMGDVYSFALVLWEILNRCEITSLISDTKYQGPYEDELAEFSWENIRELVVIKKIRPQLRSEWDNDPMLNAIKKVMVESWSGTPSVRLTCLRIKKTLFKTYTEHSK